MHRAIWIFVVFVSNYRIINGLPSEIPTLPSSSTQERVQNIDEFDFFVPSDSFEDIDKQTATPATENDDLDKTLKETTEPGLQFSEDTLESTAGLQDADDTLEHTAELQNANESLEQTTISTPTNGIDLSEVNKEEYQAGDCVNTNNTDCKINVELEATELTLPETNDDTRANLTKPQSKEIKEDTSSIPVTDFIKTFNVEKKSKNKTKQQDKKGEILAKIEKALMKSRTKKVKPQKSTIPTDSLPVDMIPIFRPKSFARGSKRNQENINNSIRGISNPYEALKIENIPSTVQNTDVPKNFIPDNINTGKLMIKSAVLRPLVNADNNNVPLNPSNAVLNKAYLQPSSIPNNVVLNKAFQQPSSFPNNVVLNIAPQRGLNTNNAVSSQPIIQKVLNVKNIPLNVATKEPVVKFKNVVLHPINQKEILNDINVRPLFKATTWDSRKTNNLNAGYTRENIDNIKSLNVLPVKEKQNDFLNLGCLAEKSLYVASNVNKDVKCKKHDSVVVLMKPETVSLEKMYGNFLKKFTMTVLVPLHVAKLNS